MSKGALLIATPHDEIDYIGFARLSARLIEKHLGIDTHIHIDRSDSHNIRQFRWHDEKTQTVLWKNNSRTLAYDISPFDQTLLIDVDYLTFNNNMLDYFDKDFEFLCYDKVWDVTGTDSFNADEKMTRAGFPMLWATVVYFRKCEFAYNVFETMKNIQSNWKFFSNLWGFKSNNYRNDFSLSIAHHLMDGYTQGTYFKHKLSSLSTEDTIYRVKGSELLIKYRHAHQEYNAVRIKDTNLHCMNKACLMDPEIRGELEHYAS
jgi:hypothetical protein